MSQYSLNIKELFGYVLAILVGISGLLVRYIALSHPEEVLPQVYTAATQTSSWLVPLVCGVSMIVMTFVLRKEI